VVNAYLPIPHLDAQARSEYGLVTSLGLWISLFTYTHQGRGQAEHHT
jgi:hypothetical protein